MSRTEVIFILLFFSLFTFVTLSMFEGLAETKSNVLKVLQDLDNK